MSTPTSFCKDHAWVDVYKTPPGASTHTTIKWCATCGCVSKQIRYFELMTGHTENLVPTYLKS
jgi:hypothetical protein